MPKKTIYVADEDVEIFDKAKEVVGESLSSVIGKALNEYLKKKELADKGMAEVIIWEGNIDLVDGSSKGINRKFTGKLLASDTSMDGCERYSLYLTVKGNYLVYSDKTEKMNEMPVMRNCSYTPYDDFNKVMMLGLPIKMINEARKYLTEIPCEELDV